MSETAIQNGDQADLKNKILKQVEFYFGDSNLPYDKFLYTLTTTNKDRWVPINTIASFKKMKLISEDIGLITEAVKESPELLEVSEDGLNVRRKTELVRPEALFERTIYAKGFPTEIDGDNKAFFELQEEIEKIFSEFGKVEAVRMRKTDTKPSKFKGSVFIEYAVLDDAKKAAEQKLKYKDTDLLIMTKEAYVAMKAEQYKDEPNSRKPKKFNAFAPNFTSPTAKSKSSYSQDSTPEGMLLKFTLENEDTSVEDIKAFVGQDQAAWVHRDGQAGFIELKQANAQEVLDTINKSEDSPIKVSLPTSEEAADHYQGRKERQKSTNARGRNSGRGGSRGGGRGGKRKFSGNPNKTAVKARKTEA